MQKTNQLIQQITTTFFVILGLSFALPTQQATAQTPVTKIENAAGDSVFVSYDDGALLGLGEVTTGIIPASGAGTRMMWYPAKAAFRTGRVHGSQWDDANIGRYSVAMGNGTTASGSQSTAMGSNTTASGLASTAMGYQTTASGSRSTAMGYFTTAATERSFSIGKYNSANTSADNTLLVVGNGTSTTPSDALVLDQDAGLVVNGELDTGSIPAVNAGIRMMWYPAKAAFRAGNVDGTQWDNANIGYFSMAIGYNTIASDRRSTAMGNGTTASGYTSTAMGSATTASENYSTAMGNGTTASGSQSTAMGSSTTASGFASTAMGGATTVSGNYSTAMGYNTTAATDKSLSIGEYNSANTSADGTLFVVGNGTSTTPSDALVLDDSGNMTIAGTLTESSDRRLKKNIVPLENGIWGKLGNITPSQFQFKNQQTHPAGTQIGLVAQEVQKQFPELVSEASNGYLSVSYSKFTAVLLKGMQEQQTEIQTLKDENKNIKKRLARLEQQNSHAAGMPFSTLGVLLLGMVIGGGLWWRSRSEQAS